MTMRVINIRATMDSPKITEISGIGCRLLNQCFGRLKHTNPQPLEQEKPCPVSAHNEWDPLEEVIVGRVEGLCVPPLTTEVKATVSKEHWRFYEQNMGKEYPAEAIEKAKQEIEYFCKVLEGEGVTVKRPDICDYKKAYQTPDFYSPVGYYRGMPRDNLLVIGNEIIEAPMSWRSRYFEYRAYRNLVKEYFSQGAKWTVAPKPLMSDELYDHNYPMGDMPARQKLIQQGKYVTTEFEPCFDAADFYRVGKDIFAHRSHVTNLSGIQWVEQHLGDDYNIHTIVFAKDSAAMHVDASILIPKPGVVLFNPDRVSNRRDFFIKAGWKVLDPPRPTIPDSHPLWFSSKWLTINNLSLDTERMIVESHEEPLIKFLEKIGIKCIKVPFRNVFSLGGGFHCYTCDIRRRGELESYF